jgi:hypothetical protein
MTLGVRTNYLEAGNQAEDQKVQEINSARFLGQKFAETNP